MLVIGAGGLVLQMLDDLVDQFGKDLAFWTDQPLPNKSILEKFSILGSDGKVKEYFTHHGNQFILGIGNPQKRSLLLDKFESLGGEAIQFISSNTTISRFANIGKGAVILHGTIIEAGSVLGKGVLVNSQVVITHEANIGEFSEIGPGVNLAGKVTIGKGCFIGSGVTVIPRVVMGDNVIVGAGAVVIGNIPDNDTVIGVPAKSIRR